MTEKLFEMLTNMVRGTYAQSANKNKQANNHPPPQQQQTRNTIS